MAIIVDKLCLQSPKADVEITDIVAEWQFFPKFKITNIEIKRVKLKGTEHLFSNITTNNKSNKNHNDIHSIHQLLSETIHPYIKQINVGFVQAQVLFYYIV